MAEPASRITSLDPLETSEHFEPADVPAWRDPAEVEDVPQKGPHMRSWRARARTIRALRRAEAPELQKRADRLVACCSVPSIRKTADNKPTLSLGRCRDRLCPLCSFFRGREASSKTADIIRRMNAPRFLTLTLRESTAGLAAELDRLFQCFRELRRRREWKRHVRGGVYAFEATYRPDRGTWHPHLHLVIDGTYIPHSLLRALWTAITGDSSIVHIEAVHDAEAQAKYLAQYINTPAELSSWAPSTIEEYATAVHGRRLLHTFGCCHGSNPDPAEHESVEPGTTHLAAVSTLRRRSELGCVHASEALSLMRRMGGFWALCTPGLFAGKPLLANPVEEWERSYLVECIEKSNAAADAPPAAPEPARPSDPAQLALFDASPLRPPRVI